MGCMYLSHFSKPRDSMQLALFLFTMMDSLFEPSANTLDITLQVGNNETSRTHHPCYS